MKFASFETKSSIRGLIDKVEMQLRETMIKTLILTVGHDWWNQVVPTNIVRMCKAWRNNHVKDYFRIGEVKEEFEYMSMGHLINVIKHNQTLFVNDFVEGTVIHLSQLCDLRNALSHPTEIPMNDIISCKVAFKGVVEQIFPHEKALKLMSELETSFDIIESIPIHNLRSSPYSEFIGREEKLDFIRSELLYHPNTWLILIDGIGGIGKSSLAFRICQEIVEEIEDGISEFQHVVWFSAKTKKLSYNFEVEDEVPDFDSLDLYLDSMLEFFSLPVISEEPLVSKQFRLNKALEITKSLLVVDNLETIDDLSIYSFLDRIPSHNKVILTSRDRRYKLLEGKGLPLEGLLEDEAIDLIKARINQNQIESLRNASDDVLRRIAQKTYGHPLILDSLLLQIYRDKPVQQALTELGNASLTKVFDFCFGMSYVMLGIHEQKVLMTLALFEDSIGLKEINFVTDLDNPETISAVETLRRFSLVKEDASDGNSLFYLLPVIRYYIKMQMTERPVLASEVMKRHATYVEDILKGTDSLDYFYNPILKNFNFQTKFDKFAARMADNALTHYNQTGEYQSSVETLDAALRLSPESSYVCQIRALIEKSEQSFGEAARWYGRATTHDPQNAILWRFWGDLERGLGSFQKAESKYTTATDLSKDDKNAWYGLGYSQSQLAKEGWISGYMKRHYDYRASADFSFSNALNNQPVTLAERKHNVKVYHQKGFNLYHLQDYEGAFKCCEEGLRLDKGNGFLIDLRRKVVARLE